MELIYVRLFGAAIAFAGGWCIVHERRMSEKVKIAQVSWQSGEGRIVQSEIKKKPGSNASYWAKIKYAYAIAEKEYTSDKITMEGEATSGRARAEARVQQYPLGSVHTVYYDPHNPQDCCLERMQKGKGAATVVGVIFVLVGLAMLLGILPQE